MTNQIRNVRNNYYISLLCFLLLSLFFSSCETVTVSREGPETLIKSGAKLEDAIHLILNDDTYIPLKDKDAYYFDKYKELTNVIIVREKEGFPVRDTVKNVTFIKFHEQTYHITNVKDIYFEKRETDTKASINAAILIVLGAGLIFLVYSVLHFFANFNKH